VSTSRHIIQTAKKFNLKAKKVHVIKSGVYRLHSIEKKTILPQTYEIFTATLALDGPCIAKTPKERFSHCCLAKPKINNRKNVICRIRQTEFLLYSNPLDSRT
jgi:hypothetical protein